MSRVTVLKIQTPQGPARAHVSAVDESVAALVLGHGAGGGVGTPDLVAASAVARSLQMSVALVEQPYRVAGRRTPPAAPRLDAAWTAILDELRGGDLRHLPLIVGGRSSGARVACRTAADTGAVGVLCLAFPLHPPGRSPAALAKTRLPELDAVAVPVLVVQGASDPFGMPPPGPTRSVVAVAGNHSLKSDLEAVRSAVGDWLGWFAGRQA